jgi:hypothetical protein
MKRLVMTMALTALVLPGARAFAQTKTITGEAKVVTATVEAIEKSRREITVKKPDGNYDVLYVPSDIKRFDTVKIGDKVTARYYENMVLTVQAPGAKSVDTASAAVTRAKEQPSGTAAHQQTITATITAIDAKAPSITFSGPRGWTYSTRVEDTKALAKVKVGDKVDITWTEALVLSLEPGK